jgi:cell wall-associated NlpC family hydrolase
MPAILDRDLSYAHLPANERICQEAMFWLKTRYKYGDKRAEAADGAHGTSSPPRGIDCSGFVVKVFQRIFPASGLNPSSLGAATLRSSPLFQDITQPRRGDLISWPDHVGIVIDPVAQKFIGAQTSTGVAVASYGSGYWALRPDRLFRRWSAFA